MAVVDGPAMSVRASGNLGPMCFASWRGLSIARDVWTGTVPNTAKQVVIQGYMTDVSQAWSGTLTEDERESWRAAAREQVRFSRVGTKYIPTGYQYFMQLNIQAKRQGFGIWVTPPGMIIPYGFGSLSAWSSAAGAKVFYHTGDRFTTIPTSHQGEMWIAGPYENGGRHPIDPEFKFVEYFDMSVTNSHFPLTNYRYYWVRARWAEKYGRVGNWFLKQAYIKPA